MFGGTSDDITLNNHIISLNPQARGAHRNLAVALLKLGRLDEALEAGSAAVELQPDSSEAQAALGAILILLNRLDEAENAFAPRAGASAIPPHRKC